MKPPKQKSAQALDAAGNPRGKCLPGVSLLYVMASESYKISDAYRIMGMIRDKHITVKQGSKMTKAIKSTGVKSCI
jgi:hypothetical protein